MKLTPEFRELLGLFNSFDVEYMVVGGYALAFHGHPRSTKDIDVFIHNTLSNAERVQAALGASGFDGDEVSLSDLQDPDIVVRFGAPPNMVDILKRIDGVSFPEAFAPSTWINVDGLELRLISRECLVRNKKASGRYQDLADLEALGEIEPRDR